MESRRTVDMRLIVLVISSDNLGIYAQHRECWRLYSKSHPDVTVYFLQQREDVLSPYIEGDVLWTSGTEATERVFEKTVAAFQMIPSSSYDFLVRTNLSSVWNFPLLLDFCATLPRENVFCGVIGNPGISGAGMILSPDVVAKMIAHHRDIDRCMWDDIDFGKIAALCGITAAPGFRCDPRSRSDVDAYWNRAYHFYLKDMRSGTRNVESELDVMHYLISKIYPSASR